MKRNINTLDRGIRLLFIPLTGILYLSGAINETTALALGLVAVVLATTAMINFCPIYKIFGISTFNKSAK